MTEYRRQPPDCPPSPPKDPADQPHPPGVDKCADLPTSTPPTLDPPEKCPTDPDCHCPGGGGSTDPNCLEKQIATLAAEIAKAANASAFKKDLETLLGKAKLAGQDYTRGKYEDLVKEWVKQDGDIAELIRKLVCALPCWKCVIECYVCPLLNELHYAEQWLYGDGTLYNKVYTLYDLLYWLGRDRDAKQRRFDRIKSVLTAWETPAKTIEANLKADRALIDAAGPLVGTQPSKAVVDIFLKLVPMHLAIAPPSGSAWPTRISREYTVFCECDTGKPDNCCGPDVGELSLRQRFIKPQPYLVDPNEYFNIICCIVEKRYHPAQDALAKAIADWTAVDSQITSLKNRIDTGLGTFEKDAKGAIPTVIDCCDFEPDGRDDRPRQTAR